MQFPLLHAFGFVVSPGRPHVAWQSVSSVHIVPGCAPPTQVPAGHVAPSGPQAASVSVPSELQGVPGVGESTRHRRPPHVLPIGQSAFALHGSAAAVSQVSQ